MNLLEDLNEQIRDIECKIADLESTLTRCEDSLNALRYMRLEEVLKHFEGTRSNQETRDVELHNRLQASDYPVLQAELASQKAGLQKTKAYRDYLKRKFSIHMKG